MGPATLDPPGEEKGRKIWCFRTSGHWRFAFVVRLHSLDLKNIQLPHVLRFQSFWCLLFPWEFSQKWAQKMQHFLIDIMSFFIHNTIKKTLYILVWHCDINVTSVLSVLQELYWTGIEAWGAIFHTKKTSARQKGGPTWSHLPGGGRSCQILGFGCSGCCCLQVEGRGRLQLGICLPWYFSKSLGLKQQIYLIHLDTWSCPLSVTHIRLGFSDGLFHKHSESQQRNPPEPPCREGEVSERPSRGSFKAGKEREIWQGVSAGVCGCCWCRWCWQEGAPW